jgi:hypothetical protein
MSERPVSVPSRPSRSNALSLAAANRTTGEAARHSASPV